MNFENSLKEILDRVEGAQAAMLMGFDGIPVAEVRREEPGFSFQDVLVEYAQLVGEGLKIAQAHDLGALDEFVVGSDRLRLVFRVLNPSYFICLLLTEGANLGKSRYVLRRQSPAIGAKL